MAHLHADGFDFYASVADLTLRWDTQSANALVSGSSTAFNTGQAVQFTANTNLTKTLPSNEGTVFVTLRHYQAGGTSGTAGQVLLLQDGAGVQCSIRWNEDGSVEALSGGSTTAGGGTSLGKATGAFSTAAWDSWQIKVVIGAAGSIEIRKNGGATPVLSVTGNTRAGTANSYCNKALLGATTGANAHRVDDVFLCSGSGAAPNDWPGDLRCLTLAPNAAVQAQFAVASSALPQAHGTNVAASLSLATNTLYFVPVTIANGGTASSIGLQFNTGLTGSANAALYDATGPGGGPGAKLAEATAVTNPGGNNIGVTFALTSPVAVARGQVVWIATMASAGTFALRQSGLSNVGYSQAQAYGAGFPATAAANAITGSTFYAWVNVTATTNLGAVQDTTQDGDASYVYSSTVGQEDLYGFPTLASQGISPVAIAGVVPFAVARKSDSGARTLSVRAKSGATDAAVVTDSAPSLSYKFEGAFLATDPATGAAWTASGVNALQVGVKVDA